jgi:hypothetical protein
MGNKGGTVQAGNFTEDSPTNGFVVYDEDWPLRSFKTLEAARQWADRNCRPQDYEIRSGGTAVRDALSLEQIMNTEALF